MASPARHRERAGKIQLPAVQAWGAVHQTQGLSARWRKLGAQVNATVLRRWVRASEADGSAAFPCHGKLTPEQEELRKLRREVSKLKAERDFFALSGITVLPAHEFGEIDRPLQRSANRRSSTRHATKLDVTLN